MKIGGYKVSYDTSSKKFKAETKAKQEPTKEPEVPACEYEVGKTWNYDYKGNAEKFTTPCEGNYKLEVWGAQGGTGITNGKSSITRDGYPGNGGFSAGNIILKKDDILYIYVGQKGTDAVVGKDSASSFNGGGSGTWDGTDDESSGGGGGATDIRKVNGDWNDLTSLTSRIIVAGGGGGVSCYYPAGAGGGLQGGLPSGTGKVPATQTSGNALGAGKNGSGDSCSDGVAGGGGGYYGGISQSTSGECSTSGGGGSGYIDSTLTSALTIIGTESFASPDGSSETGHTGNGYARITYLGK